MTLEQRIDNILGPWPTPDQTREALLLLAREHDAGEEHVTLDPAHKGRVARTPDGTPWIPAERYDEMVARYMAVQAEVAEHRRHVATVMQREDALKKRVEELERECDDAKEQATSLASLARVSKALAAMGAETIAAQQQHIEARNRRLAERNADAQVGRAIRELRPREGHTAVSFVVSIGDTGNRYARTEWLDDQRATPWESGWQNGDDCEMAAIREYNERED